MVIYIDPDAFHALLEPSWSNPVFFQGFANRGSHEPNHHPSDYHCIVALRTENRVGSKINRTWGQVWMWILAPPHLSKESEGHTPWVLFTRKLPSPLQDWCGDWGAHSRSCIHSSKRHSFRGGRAQELREHALESRPPHPLSATLITIPTWSKVKYWQVPNPSNGSMGVHLCMFDHFYK